MAELVTCVALIAFLVYLAWAFIGYALQFERGEGASIVYALPAPLPTLHPQTWPLCLPLACHVLLLHALRCGGRVAEAGPHACRAGDPEK